MESTNFATNEDIAAATERQLNLGAFALPPGELLKTMLPIWGVALALAIIMAPWSLEHIFRPFLASLGNFQLGQPRLIVAVLGNLLAIFMVGSAVFMIGNIWCAVWLRTTQTGLARLQARATKRYQAELRSILAGAQNPPTTKDLSRYVSLAERQTIDCVLSINEDIWGFAIVATVILAMLEVFVATDDVTVFAQLSPGILLGVIALLQLAALMAFHVATVRNAQIDAYCADKQCKPPRFLQPWTIGLVVGLACAHSANLHGDAIKTNQYAESIPAALQHYLADVAGQCVNNIVTRPDRELCALTGRAVETLIDQHGNWLNDATQGIIEVRRSEHTDSRNFAPQVRVKFSNNSRTIPNQTYHITN